MKTRQLASCVLGLGLALGAVGASAQPLPSLVTGASVLRQPGTTFNFTVQVSNTSALTNINDFTAFVMGYQLLAEPGAVGTLSIVSASQPAVTPMLRGTAQDVTFNPAAELPAAINGTVDYVSVGLGNDPEQGNTLLPEETRNLVTLGVQASADADGQWKLYAVNDFDIVPVSFWQKEASVSLDDFQFGNLPWSPEPTSLQLAVIAVPEPSGLAFAGVAVLAMAGRVIRRRAATRNAWQFLTRSSR